MRGGRRKIPRKVLEFLSEEFAYKWVHDWSETWYRHIIMRKFHGDAKK